MDLKQANALKKAIRAKEKQHNIEPADITISTNGDLIIRLNKTALLKGSEPINPRTQRDLVTSVIQEKIGVDKEDLQVKVNDIKERNKVIDNKDNWYTQDMQLKIKLHNSTPIENLQEFADKLWEGLNQAAHTQESTQKTYAPKRTVGLFGNDRNSYGTLGADRHFGYSSKGNKLDMALAMIADIFLGVITLGIAWMLSGGPPVTKNLRNSIHNTIEEPKAKTSAITIPAPKKEATAEVSREIKTPEKIQEILLGGKRNPIAEAADISIEEEVGPSTAISAKAKTVSKQI